MENGHDWRPEDVAARQITAVCLQIYPTEASPIKATWWLRDLQLLTQSAAASLLHQRAEDCGPCRPFERHMTRFSRLFAEPSAYFTLEQTSRSDKFTNSN